MTIDREWLTATLSDTLEYLSETIDRLGDERLDAEEILLEDVANVYAKLHYAVNTAVWVLRPSTNAITIA